MLWVDIPGWTCSDMEALYREMARSYSDGVFVELGVAYGRSLALLARCAGSKAKIYGIDTWHEFIGQDNLHPVVVAHQKQFGTPREACQENLRRCGVLDRVQLPVGDSAVMASKFKDASCDFVFIDANHHYLPVRTDIRAWIPKIKPGGVLAGHDYSPELFPGVAQAVDEEFGDRARVKGVVWRVQF